MLCVFVVGGLNDLITRMQNASANTTGNIPFFYQYRYDGGRTATNIRDGGGDMYDGGNAVSLKKSLFFYLTPPRACVSGFNLWRL